MSRMMYGIPVHVTNPGFTIVRDIIVQSLKGIRRNSEETL